MILNATPFLEVSGKKKSTGETEESSKWRQQWPWDRDRESRQQSSQEDTSSRNRTSSRTHRSHSESRTEWLGNWNRGQTRGSCSRSARCWIDEWWRPRRKPGRGLRRGSGAPAASSSASEIWAPSSIPATPADPQRISPFSLRPLDEFDGSDQNWEFQQWEIWGFGENWLAEEIHVQRKEFQWLNPTPFQPFQQGLICTFQFSIFFLGLSSYNNY